MKGFLFTCYGIDYFVPTTRERISDKFAEKIIRKIATKAECNKINIMNLQRKAFKCEIKDGVYYGIDLKGKVRTGNIGSDREGYIELEVENEQERKRNAW